MQEKECGDGSNLVLSLAGELMFQAQQLIQMGLHPSEILIGYEKAAKLVYAELEKQTCHTLSDIKNHDELKRCM
jgi:T-complex protein 1 subunit theta